MKNTITTLLISAAIAISGCATAPGGAGGYTVKVNGVNTHEQKEKGLSSTEIGLLILSAGAIAYMGLSTGNKGNTDTSGRDACRAAAQTEYEWQQCTTNPSRSGISP